MNEIIQPLLLDHDHMRRMLASFENQLAIFARAERPDYEILSDSLAYCKDYLEIWHHPCEDRLLELLDQRDPEKAASLIELSRQHRELAEDTSRVVRVFRDVAERGAVHFREDLVRSGRELSAAYRTHIEWEEANFFPVVQQALTASDWELLREEKASASHPANADLLRIRYPALFEAIEVDRQSSER